jgi:hypothetical protein
MQHDVCAEISTVSCQNWVFALYFERTGAAKPVILPFGQCLEAGFLMHLTCAYVSSECVHISFYRE